MKTILILIFVLTIFQLNSMDPLSPSVEALYKELGNELKDLTGKKMEERWDIVKKVYKKLALQYHPDRNPGRDDIREKWDKISNAYTTFEKLLTEQKGPTLEQQMEEARFKAEVLIRQADDIDQPNEARILYEEAVDPFFPEKLIGYGFDVMGIAYYKATNKYYQKSEYENALKYGKAYLETIDAFKADTEIFKPNLAQFNLTGQSYISRMGKPYIAKDAYNEMLTNFEKITKIVELAQVAFKDKVFAPVWIQTKQDFNSGNVAQIKKALKLMDDYEQDYGGGIGKPLLNNSQREEYLKGYLKLSDAYLHLDNKAEAIKALEKGLKYNNSLKARELISSDLKDEFESRLKFLKTGQKPSTIPQTPPIVPETPPTVSQKESENFLEAFKQLIRSFSLLQSKLSTS